MPLRLKRSRAEYKRSCSNDEDAQTWSPRERRRRIVFVRPRGSRMNQTHSAIPAASWCESGSGISCERRSC